MAFADLADRTDETGEPAPMANDLKPLTLTFATGMVMDLFTITERMPDRGETFLASHMEEHPGGKGANAAIAAYRYSRVNPNGPTAANESLSHDEDLVNVRVIGAIGSDGYGQACLQPLKDSHIDVSGIRVIDGQRTGVSTIIVEQDFNENRILQLSGANKHLFPKDFETLEAVTGGVRPDLLTSQLELPRDTVEQMLRIAQHEGIDTLLNPSPASVVLEEVLAGVTHLIVNETEAALLSDMDVDELNDIDAWEEVTSGFLSAGVKNVVLTLGARGAYYSNASGHKGHVEAQKVENVRDPTGAGDAFVGTYAVEYVRQKRRGDWDIRYAVDRACRVSAHVIQAVGCQSALPWANELDEPPPDATQGAVRPHNSGVHEEQEALQPDAGADQINIDQ